MSLVKVIALLALAMLEGSLVALPRAGALASLTRVRSPAWAAILPGLILAGTFIPLWRPNLVSVPVISLAVITPLLALLAAASVARGGGTLLVGGIAVALGVALVLGAEGSPAATLVTAFGCMSVGVALVRLIPRRWLILAVVATACLDASLLAMHVGQPAAALVSNASAHLHGRAFNQGMVGPMTVDYPDLVLAAALGGFVAGEPVQRSTAIGVTLLTAASGMLLLVLKFVPETVPIGLMFVLVASRSTGSGVRVGWRAGVSTSGGSRSRDRGQAARGSLGRWCSQARLSAGRAGAIGRMPLTPDDSGHSAEDDDHPNCDQPRHQGENHSNRAVLPVVADRG